VFWEDNIVLDDIKEILLSEEQITKKVEELGAKITADYKNKNLLMVSILKGSVVFMADLMRQIKLPHRIDFMAVSSYGTGVKSSGVVKITKDLDILLEGYDLLIVEDILDSGLTLHYIIDILKSRKPKSIAVCTLLDKPECRKVEVKTEYSGFSIPDKFVVGYGLDYSEKYRNLPFIGILKPEIYSK
jgi:hypoxanthine phosphoribosyltransferase